MPSRLSIRTYKVLKYLGTGQYVFHISAGQNKLPISVVTSIIFPFSPSLFDLISLSSVQTQGLVCLALKRMTVKVDSADVMAPQAVEIDLATSQPSTPPAKSWRFYISIFGLALVQLITAWDATSLAIALPVSCTNDPCHDLTFHCRRKTFLTQEYYYQTITQQLTRDHSAVLLG